MKTIILTLSALAILALDAVIIAEIYSTLPPMPPALRASVSFIVGSGVTASTLFVLGIVLLFLREGLACLWEDLR